LAYTWESIPNMPIWLENESSPNPNEEANQPNVNESNIAKAEEQNVVAWQYVVSLMNRVEPFTVIPSSTATSIHKYLPEGLSVCYESIDATLSLQGTPWLAFTKSISSYPPEVRDAKQPNGHSRTREATIAEIKRTTLGKKINCLFVGANADAKLLKHFPKSMVVILEVEDLRDPPMELVNSIPLKAVETTKVYKGSEDNVLSPYAHIIFVAGEGPPPEWPVNAVDRCLSRRNLKLHGALDLFDYLDAIRLTTHTQCIAHNKQ
jgi:hypothetical protein